MKNKLKIQDLDNFQEDLSQEFATADPSIIQGGMLAETTESVAIQDVAIASDERLIAYPLPQPEPKPYPLPVWPPYPCCCYPYPYPDKPIKIDSKDGIDSIFIGWCPVIL
jgi:hypothetical protein